MRTVPSQAGPVCSCLQSLHWDPVSHRFHWNWAALPQLLEPHFSEALLPLAQLISSPLMLTLGSGLSPQPAVLLLKQKGHQVMASSCLLCSLHHMGKNICSAFPSASVDEVFAGRAAFNPAQASLPTHLVPHPVHVNAKPLATQKPPFSKAMSPAAVPALRVHTAPPTDPLLPPGHACTISALLVLGASARTWPRLCPSLPCLPAASAASLSDAMLCKRQSRLLAPPALQTDSSHISPGLMAQPQPQHMAGRL